MIAQNVNYSGKCGKHLSRLIKSFCYLGYIASYYSYLSEADLGGKVALAPFKNFYLYVTATINSMKFSFNDV